MPIETQATYSMHTFLTIIGIETTRDFAEIERFAHHATVDIENVEACRFEVCRRIVRTRDEELE